MRCGQHLLLHPPPGGSGGKVGLLERSPSGRSPNVHRTKSIDIGEITFTREQMGAPAGGSRGGAWGRPRFPGCSVAARLWAVGSPLWPTRSDGAAPWRSRRAFWHRR